MKLKYYKGSYTVEASLLLGIILAVVFSVLYLSFISHDKFRLSLVLREVALWGAMKIEQGEEVTEEMLIFRAKNQNIKLLNLKNVSFNGVLKGDKVLVSYTAKEFSLVGNGEIIGFEIVELIHRPERFLRISHLLIGEEEK